MADLTDGRLARSATTAECQAAPRKHASAATRGTFAGVLGLHSGIRKQEETPMTKLNTLMFTAAALGAVAVTPASAMPASHLSATAPGDVQQARLVCGRSGHCYRTGYRYRSVRRYY